MLYTALQHCSVSEILELVTGKSCPRVLWWRSGMHFLQRQALVTLVSSLLRLLLSDYSLAKRNNLVMNDRELIRVLAHC